MKPFATHIHDFIWTINKMRTQMRGRPPAGTADTLFLILIFVRIPFSNIKLLIWVANCLFFVYLFSYFVPSWSLHYFYIFW